MFCRDEPQRVVGARQGSPLVLGVGQKDGGRHENFIASDAMALAGFTDQIVYLEEGDVVDLQLGKSWITSRDAASGRWVAVQRPVRTVQVELKLKTPWRDGTTHLVMSPLEFMQRLAALVPRPRLHLITFHGVLAPNAKLRPLVVPQGPPAQEESVTEAAVTAGCEVEPVHARPNRIGWARLLKRVFDIDMQRCPNCGGGELKIIAAILERSVIEKILTHLGLDPQPPPNGRAREVLQD